MEPAAQNGIDPVFAGVAAVCVMPGDAVKLAQTA